MKTAPAEIVKKLKDNKYALIVLAAGLLLLLLSGLGSGRDKAETETPESVFNVEREEERLEELLGQIAGAGRVSVLLSVEGSQERELASDEDGYLVVSAGSGVQQAVDRRQVYPRYVGAVVVCQGADSSGVRLELTRAVAAFTGLGSDRIVVIKMD